MSEQTLICENVAVEGRSEEAIRESSGALPPGDIGNIGEDLSSSCVPYGAGKGRNFILWSQETSDWFDTRRFSKYNLMARGIDFGCLIRANVVLFWGWSIKLAAVLEFSEVAGK